MRISDEALECWIEKEKDHLIQDILEAVRIPSISASAEGIYPFGKDCAKMLDYMRDVLSRYGFGFENHEYYCGSSLVPGSEGNGEIGIFGHLDVVPAGKGWVKDPFDAYTRDGYIVGRGCMDNKGSVFACLYAMRFLAENGICLKNNVRMLFGCNEEDGMADAIYYREHYKVPDLTIVPDSWWPVSRSEKGVFIIQKNARIQSGNLLRFDTIGADNTVPNLCVCEYRTEDMETAKKCCSVCPDIEFEDHGDKVTLIAHGIGTHASFPEGSRSAVRILTDFLLENEQLTGDAKTVIAFVAESIKDYEGKCMDIDFRDSFAGNTTNVLTRTKLEEGKLFLAYKICYPAAEGVEKQEVYERLIRFFDRSFLEPVYERASGPHFVPKDHPVIEMFCRNASEVFGTEMKPFSQAGGTYAWEIPNSFAAGPSVHHRPQTLFREPGNGAGHQPNECVEIENLLKAIKIYVRVLLEIDEWLADEKNRK